MGNKKLDLPTDNKYSTKLKQSVNRLMKFEEKLIGDKKQKKRKRETENESQVPKKKTRKDENVDFFANKLQEFIENSERQLTKRKKLKKKKVVDGDVDLPNSKSVFKRNSGTWYVSDENVKETPSLASPQAEVSAELVNESGPTIVDEEQEELDLDLSPSEDIEDEEYEIFIPSRRRKVTEANQKFQKELVENPFSKPETPSSTRKVKIALNLNQSQEFHEHQMQILKSPAIPFDTNKKPLKPLLKPSPVSSPINPFYNKKNLFGTSF